MTVPMTPSAWTFPRQPASSQTSVCVRSSVTHWTPTAVGKGRCAQPRQVPTPRVRKRGEAGKDEDPCASDADCEHGLGCTQDQVCRAWCTLAAEAGLEAGATVSECPAHSTCEPAANALGLGQCSKPCPVPDVLGSECSILPTSCGCGDGTTCHAEQLGKTVCEAPGPNGYMTWCDKNALLRRRPVVFGKFVSPSLRPGASTVLRRQCL